MRQSMLGLCLVAACAGLQAKTYLVTFTGYSVSPSGEACGGQNVYGEGVSFPGSGMLEILQKLKDRKPVSELEMKAFTFFNTGFGLACTAPFDGEADHAAAEEFLRGRVTPEDFVIVAGHSYGGHRALLFAEQFQRKFQRGVNAVVLADPIDWTACSIRGILSGGNLSNCRQQGMTLDLPTNILNPSWTWNFRQTRGLRVLFFTVPVLSGYQVTAGSLPVRSSVVSVTHTEVDDLAAVQSLLERLALTNSNSTVNSAEETPSASQ